jgi:hypothetical protein
MKNKLTKNLMIPIIFSLVLLFIFAIQIQAEQSGESPESGSDSHLKQGYDWLVVKGTNYGGTDSADWTEDWGTYWNRIMEAASWEPGGDLSASDVFSGKTFYGGLNNRDVQTGILDQSLMEYDNYEDGDSEAEESTWTNTAGAADSGVWQDQRTDLYWSIHQGLMSNTFPDQDHSSCDFFSESDRGNYDGSDADCGDAINICATLELDADGDSIAETDWYLPSQGELMQAYLDGIYNQTNAIFVSGGLFWSSTEVSDTTSDAWYVILYYGATRSFPKDTDIFIDTRCVRRD